MNGFDEPYWNLLQVLAWVWLGDRDIVMQAGDGAGRWAGSFFQEVRLPPDGASQMIETSAGAFSHMTLCLLGAGLGQHDSIENREAKIHDALKRGDLEGYGIAKDANGIVKGDGDLRLVPPLEWSRLRLCFPLDDPPYAAALTGTQWHDLKFSRAQVMLCWPDPLAADRAVEGETRRRPGAPPRKKEAVKAAMRKLWPDGIPADLKQAAVQKDVEAELAREGKITASPRTIDAARKELASKG